MNRMQKIEPPGTSLISFPGKKYQVRRGTAPIGTLTKEAKRLAIELGPDHPKVKMMRKEIAERQKRR